MIHYTPDDTSKCYVYARTYGEQTVLVILNGSDTVRILDPARFSEVIGGNMTGKDVVSGEVIPLTAPVVVAPRAAYVLELSK